jgi:uncharacterized membrane protein
VTLVVLVLAAAIAYLLRRASDNAARIEALNARLNALVAQRTAASPSPPAAAAAAEPSPATAPPLLPRTPAAPATTAMPSRAPAALAPTPTAPSAPLHDRESLERLIGAQWLLYIGVIAIVVGVSYFEKLAIDNGWIGETARVIQGSVVGVLLVAGGIRLANRGYARYGQIISGGGIAVLYLCAYAAFNLYGLIGYALAFAVMCAITAATAVLADRQRSPGLGLLAVSGGFATPFLLRSRIDPYVALFVFDTILIAGTTWLARRRGWRWLNAVSYVATALSLSTWAADFFEPWKYLWTEIFLTLFCAIYSWLLKETRLQDRGTAGSVVQVVLWSAPPAYYVASLGVLAGHAIPQLVFLVAFAVAGVVVAVRGGAVVRLAFWIAVAVPLLAWMGDHGSAAWLVAGSVAVAAVYATFALAQLEMVRRRTTPLEPADILLLHANALGAYGAAYLLVGPIAHRPTGWIAVGFTLWHLAAAAAIARRSREYALHTAAVGFTLLTIAVALLLNGVWMTAAWAAEGAIIIAAGLHERRDWLRTAGAWLFAIAIARLLDLLFSTPPIAQTALFNRRAACATFLIALAYALAWLHHRDPTAPPRRIETAAAVVVAQALTIALITSEIVGYWAVHDAGRQGALARGLMLSIAWAIYATALVVVGIARRYAPLRYVAFVVFAATIVKVFAVDLSELDRIYRVSSVIGLGIALLFASFLYQQFRVDSPADHAQ